MTGTLSKQARAEERRAMLLAQARAAQTIEPAAQHYVVNKLIHEVVLSGTCTPAEVLKAAYGDPEGRRYWKQWLFEPKSVYQFAECLAVHDAATKQYSVLDGSLRGIFERLRAAAEARETWFLGDTSILVTENWSSLALHDCALAVRPREAVAWLLRNPNARHLVPTTLEAVVESSAGHAISPPAAHPRDETPEPTTPPTSFQRRPKGPQRGTVDRYGAADRALFPEVKRIVDEQHKSVHAATLDLASAGKVDGAGSSESRAKRLARRFRAEPL